VLNFKAKIYQHIHHSIILYAQKSYQHTSIAYIVLKLSVLQECDLVILACSKRPGNLTAKLRHKSQSNKTAQHCSYCE